MAIPGFIHIPDGKLYDVHALALLLPEPGALYVMDRGYLDFERLFTLYPVGAFFVTRLKSNINICRIYATSENVVKVQVWTAASVYVLVAIVKKRFNLKPSLYTMLQIFPVEITRMRVSGLVAN